MTPIRVAASGLQTHVDTAPAIQSIVVATELEPGMDPAFHVAAAIAARNDARVQVVSTDAAGEALAAFCRDAGADLLITGRGRQSLNERLASDGLASLLQHVPCPVLVAAPKLAGAPARIVVGVELSEDDLAVARVAHAIMAPGGCMKLAHVRVNVPFATPTGPAWAARCERDVFGRMCELRDEITAERESISVVSLAGHPGYALAEQARAFQADLIAVGTHSRGFIQRALLGSTTMHLLHTSLCSLLAVPPRD